MVSADFWCSCARRKKSELHVSVSPYMSTIRAFGRSFRSRALRSRPNGSPPVSILSRSAPAISVLDGASVLDVASARDAERAPARLLLERALAPIARVSPAWRAIGASAR